MDQLRVNEFFLSIQGESTWAGLACAFVRLTGCHLRCRYCDTEYAFHEGRKFSVAHVVQQVQAMTGDHCRLVEITGGEPLLQPAVHPLMTQLADLGYTVLLETSGACDITPCDPRVIRIMDLKTPDSGEESRNLWSNLRHLHAHDELKMVLCSRADYDWACGVIAKHRLHEQVAAVLLSPAGAMPAGKEIAGVPGLSLNDLATWMIEDQKTGRLPSAGVRIQTQLHKLIWHPSTRGV